jgi:hypothetical protein
MKQVIKIICLLLCFNLPANAEVFKCQLAAGKTVYQPKPCPSAALNARKVEIEKQSPEQIQAAKDKLQAWKAEQAASEAEKAKAAKELQEQWQRQETIDALNRNAIAQEQQAIAAQRQAEALERRNYNAPFYGPLYYTPQTYGAFPKRHRHHQDHRPVNSDANRPTYPKNQPR